MMTSQAMPVATEHQEQVTLFLWANRSLRTFPALRLLFAIPNGAMLIGKTVIKADGRKGRFSREALKLRAEGLKAGVPDLCLPVARAGFHGLYIEMKRTKGGVLSDEQKQWIADLAAEGYCAICCKGWEQARDAIKNYLLGHDPRGMHEEVKKGRP